MSGGSSHNALDVETIRKDFPIFSQRLSNGKPFVFVDSAASAQKPQLVIDKEDEVYQRYYANAYRGVYEFGARVDEELDGASDREGSRQKVQHFLGASEPEEVVFTSGATMSINLVANAWGRKFLQPGDEVLITLMEHHANLVPWQRITAERGARLRYLPLTDDRRLDLSKLDEFLTPKTRIVALTQMSNVLGTINPIEEIVARAKELGTLVLVDGAQSIPHRPINVVEAGIDFLAFSGHKLFGPTGVGVLWGRRQLLEEMDPFLCGGHMIAEVHLEHSTWAPAPAKFEAGTIPIAQAIALGTAIDYVSSIGWDAVHAHERRLLEHAHARLTQIPGLTIHGPGVEHKGPIVSFTVKNAHPEDLAQLLNLKGICVRHGHHCTMPLHDYLGISASVRASFALYNTIEEIDALADAIEFARGKLRLA